MKYKNDNLKFPSNELREKIIDDVGKVFGEINNSKLMWWFIQGPLCNYDEYMFDKDIYKKSVVIMDTIMSLLYQINGIEDDMKKYLEKKIDKKLKTIKSKQQEKEEKK